MQAHYSSRNIDESEPYYVANTASHLTFDERYVGYGADKVEHFYRVACEGRELVVAHDLFMVHITIGSFRDWKHTHASGAGDADVTTTSTRAATGLRLENNMRWTEQNRAWFEGSHGHDASQGFRSCDGRLFYQPWTMPWSAMYPTCVLKDPGSYRFATGDPHPALSL